MENASGPKLSQLAPDATRKLVEFTASLKFSDLPPAVVAHAKVLALDSIGCCLYGATLPWTRKVMDMVRDDGEAARATVIGGGFKSSASQAVLVNSTAGHAFESDDMHKASLFHPGSIRLPVALACAEAENGLPGYEMVAWQGLFAPRATPPAIIQRLNHELSTIVQQPDLKKQLAAEGGEPVGNSPEEFAQWLKTDIAKWTRVVREANIKVE